MKQSMPKELKRIKKLYQRLIRQELKPFPKAGKPLSAPDKHGVYIIYSPKEHVLHVGRTLRGRKGLRQRLKNHLHGRSSFAVRYLERKGSKLRRGYTFSYILVLNARTRALLEAYAVGNLCPKHLGLGEGLPE